MPKQTKTALKISEDPEEKKEVPKAKARPVLPPLPKCVSFQTWATMRGVKDSHRLGMQAHVSNSGQPRPIAVWDNLFADY